MVTERFQTYVMPRPEGGGYWKTGFPTFLLGGGGIIQMVLNLLPLSVCLLGSQHSRISQALDAQRREHHLVGKVVMKRKSMEDSTTRGEFFWLRAAL